MIKRISQKDKVGISVANGVFLTGNSKHFSRLYVLLVHHLPQCKIISYSGKVVSVSGKFHCTIYTNI
jgi:hypothetical protein